MSIETIISSARKRVLSRVSAIISDGRSHATAVRRQLIVETAGRMGDIENCVGDTIKAAMVAQEERSENERAYYAIVEEVLSESLREIGRRKLELLNARKGA